MFTAGVTEDLQWVRLCPIDFRYRPKRSALPNVGPRTMGGRKAVDRILIR